MFSFRFSVLLLSALIPHIFAQTPGISGTVSDTARKPLSGIALRLDPGGTTTITDSDGRFALPNPGRGTFLLTATGRGFVPV